MEQRVPPDKRQGDEVGADDGGDPGDRRVRRVRRAVEPGQAEPDGQDLSCHDQPVPAAEASAPGTHARGRSWGRTAINTPRKATTPSTRRSTAIAVATELVLTRTKTR